MDDAQTALTDEADLPPAPLTLYRVDGRGRVNLDGIVTPGVEFYTASKSTEGLIILAPVRVATTAIPRTASATPGTDA